MPFDLFANFLKRRKELRNDQFVVIIDEFDSIVFDDEIPIVELKALFDSINTLIGFTGSELKDFHVRLIQKLISG